MPKLSHSEIYKLATDAGFNQQSALTATAVALAESGGNTDAHNTTPPDDSYGLWQINMLGSLGPARMKQFGISSPSQLFDPKTNAKAAFIIYKNAGYRFSPWTTFTSGAYKSHLAEGSVPANVVGGVQNAASALDVGGAVNAVGDTLFKGVAGLTGVIIGITLIVLAVVILLRNQIPVKKLVNKVVA